MAAQREERVSDGDHCFPVGFTLRRTQFPAAMAPTRGISSKLTYKIKLVTAWFRVDFF
jgi:hypothetical protein